MRLLNKIPLLFCMVVLFATNSFAFNKLHEVKIEPEFAIVKGMESKIRLSTFDSLGNEVPINCFSSVYVNDQKIDVYFTDGVADFSYNFEETTILSINCGEVEAVKEVNPIPLWFSILPPLIAILCALLFKEVFSALFLGLFSGTFIIYLYSGVSVFSAFFKS
ncbi:MAG: hypothetical protein PHE33_10750, partial [Bacteroidales bacterium]|nr:hypothetical protein [Bacteroidales bacterium]